ncbi:MAG: pyridoxal phosphate-dependent decarboxylase family protein [Acidobacteriota bacterium]
MSDPSSQQFALEPDTAEMRSMLDAVGRRLVEHVASLPEQPADGTDGALQAARAATEELPREGRPLDELLDYLFEEAIPRSYNTAGPGYLAYIPGGGLFESALAALAADGVNRYVGVFAAAPVLARLEANVVAWFAEIVGYPATARGFLTSGGSLANFSGIVTARRELLPDDFLDGAIYASDQAHHSVMKAAVLAGFPEDRVRIVPSDDRFRLRLDALEERMAADREAGLRPFLLVASAGTTNTGAIDPLPEMAEIADRDGLWLHVDASYGGLFALTGRGREALRGIERSDSVVLDPHKSLFLPYGSGCLMARDGDALRRAHTAHADYMPPMQEDPELVDFCEISPELSRGFRGLRVWLPLKLHGIGPFRRALQEKLELTDWITERLRETDEVDIVAEPQVTVVAWRWRPDGIEGEALDDLNRDLMDRINARKRVYLTGTRLRGRFVIRICVLSFRTHRERMEMALEDIRGAIRELRREIVGSPGPPGAPPSTAGPSPRSRSTT